MIFYTFQSTRIKKIAENFIFLCQQLRISAMSANKDTIMLSDSRDYSS
mgnify:CR=1 FL=1